MSSSLSDWQVAPELRPKPQDYGYDLEAALGSIADEGHGWDDDPGEWVRDQRRSDARRSG